MKEEALQKQFLGFLKTPLLWSENLLQLNQFEEALNSDINFDGIIEKKLRLGHLVEYFVSSQFNQDSSIEILAQNVQVLIEKRTVGEFDFLIQRNSINYHIEVVYKFYLFDPSVGETEIEHCIGPNRKDALIQKMNKIKSKQFPLIDSPGALEVLNNLNIEASTIQQRVYFKGKIFVPFGQKIELETLNPASVVGFYIPFHLLEQFKMSTIHIPIKHDWLVEPHLNVKWKSFNEANATISSMMEEQRSPLVWFKDEFDQVSCGFVTWW